MIKKFALTIIIAALTCAPIVPAQALSEKKAMELIKSKIGLWLQNPIITNAIKAQNLANANITEEKLFELDERWRSDDKDLIDSVLNNLVSEYLKEVVAESEGLYSEVFIMDNKGLNVGQNTKTSDYWQGDEAKWQQTYMIGKDAVHIGDVKFDDSTQIYQTQLSITISDGDTPIGAVTIGFEESDDDTPIGDITIGFEEETGK